MPVRKQLMRLFLGLCLLVAVGWGQGFPAKAPPNAAGVVCLPASDPDSVIAPDTAKYVGKQGARLVYEIDSGNYRFTVKGRGN